MNSYRMLIRLLTKRPSDFNGCLYCLRSEYMLNRYGHACNCPNSGVSNVALVERNKAAHILAKLRRRFPR